MFSVANTSLKSRLFLGTALYPSPEVMVKAIQASGAEVVTASLRRQSPKDNSGKAFWDIVRQLCVHVLPNTAGCRSVKEAVATAHMARELFLTSWIKLEVIGDDYNLQPDPFGLVAATHQLAKDGFEVFAYTTDDLVVAQRLVDAGCRIIMPWAAPIGTGQGLVNKNALKTLRARLPDVTLIVDAGIGRPSDAVQVMELGFDGVLLNTAVALAQDPVAMAKAFALSIEAGRLAYESGIMNQRDTAVPTTPTVGVPFWHQ